jgi:hypothetical protein
MVYLVSYDLITPGQENPALIDQIKAFGGVRVLASTWLLVSDQPAVEIREQLDAVMDRNDRLLVIEVTRHAAWARLLTDHSVVRALLTGAAASG